MFFFPGNRVKKRTCERKTERARKKNAGKVYFRITKKGRGNIQQLQACKAPLYGAYIYMCVWRYGMLVVDETAATMRAAGAHVHPPLSC